jgi:hypothetical protein
MAGRARPQIKSKVVKATLANKDVLEMFQGVLGTSEGSATLSITHPKYVRIQKHISRFIDLLAALLASRLMTFFPGPHSHLEAYLAALRGQFAESFSAPDFAAWSTAGEPDYARIPPEVVAQFGAVFAAAKKCNVVNTVIVTCKNLVPHKKALADRANLKDKFLSRDAGVSFAPLPDLSRVNFKQMYVDDRLDPGDREFILVVLHKMYVISHDVYEAVSAPDIDVDEFVEVIMSSIGEVKKQIPRCDGAFQKIIESVDLLKGNFSGYYKDYVASSNPTIIMENFVIDVSKNTQASPTVTAQFRRIISHYRKLASQQATNPKLQSLFAQVDANFAELEKKSREAESESESEDEDDMAAAPADGSAATAAPVPTTAAAAAAPVPAVAPSAAAAVADVQRRSNAAARCRRKKAAKQRRAAAAAADTADADTADDEGDEAAAPAGEDLSDWETIKETE